MTAEPVRRRRKPRDWSVDEKARIVAATLQPGANVSAVARSEGLDPSQLYGWRRKALASGVVAPLTEETGKQIKFARVEASGQILRVRRNTRPTKSTPTLICYFESE
ncbi:transposase [Rhizobium sp. 2YAF20]|uniref:transposase n=1 Tax=Rhizobium sp. 2YAF20 TaxID=3233027 RepID=UPI003F9A1326